MKKLKICKNEEDALYFILSQFVITHDLEECRNIYTKEIKLSKRLIKEYLTTPNLNNTKVEE